MNHSLPPELCELEQLLSSFSPQALSEETAHRLSAACEESASCPDSHDLDLSVLEKHLGEIAPATMRTDVLSRMIKAMDSWHEHVPVEEKIVSFSCQNTQQVKSKPRPVGMLAAVAVVALLGAVTAFMVPQLSPEEINDSVATNYPVSSDSIEEVVSGQPDSRQAWFAANALSHRVVNSADRGIIMSENQTPHRCIRLDGMETIKIEDEDGREITIDRPSVQFVLIPVETN